MNHERTDEELMLAYAAGDIAAFELLYARRLAASGGVVLSAERIPAPIVNAIMDLAEQA